MKKKLNRICLLLLIIGLQINPVFAEPTAAPCDLFTSGINFGSYRADGKVQNSVTGRIGIGCKSPGGGDHYCVGFDAGSGFHSSGTNDPFIPRDGEGPSPQNYISYHIYQPNNAQLLVWGNTITLPNQNGGTFCFSAAACAEVSPCEFPVIAKTDPNQSAKADGGYSYNSSGSHPFFVLYKCSDSTCRSVTGTNIYEHLMVTAYVNKGCSVSTKPFNFGPVNDNSIAPIGQSGAVCVYRPKLISVNCGPNTTYNISLQGGVKDLSEGLGCPAGSWCMGNYTNVPWSYLTYNLFKGTCSTSNLWNDTSMVTCTTNCDNVSYDVYGQLTGKSSKNIPSGLYEDIVNVIVSYTSP